ncbi:hypothetical protein GCM10011348_25690 [Marinobacterium nitratireducens]|uniref:Uncharacterized protein n=1 Tax=Marinobacterium nitratireducens TaxID=518897 RepID=A0A917ZJL0_9GAMM|nr:OsmC family protein [Marinobacterium nitratireducens]GGO82997.1 hypothetical protein GCM10011348_25690 [Marinobacterium nitratireducens]
MQALPHHYDVFASASAEGDVNTRADGKPEIAGAAPVQFGGPGDRWSPEELLMAAVADCLILTFRAVARNAGLDWRELEVRSSGTLDRVEGVTRFTKIHTEARLGLAPGQDATRAGKLLEKSESACLVTRSLLAETALSLDIYESGS